MPESVTDRPTSATEMVFLFTKSPRYFYDAMAIAERTVDAEAVSEYCSDHETMHVVPHRNGRKQFPQSKAGKRRINQSLSDMQRQENGHMAGDAGRTGEIKGCEPQGEREASQKGFAFEIQQVAGATCGQRGLAQNGEGASLSACLSEVGQSEGRSKEVLRNRNGESVHCTLPVNGQGKGFIGARGPQASQQDECPKHTHGIGVESDKGTSPPSMPLLQEGDGTIDDGPHHTLDKGWSSCGVKHRPGLPQLQQSEGQPSSPSNLRNARNWWVINSAPFAEAHFATFPPALAERCIKAGTSERGCCADCGAPWVRMVERGDLVPPASRPDAIQCQGNGETTRATKGAAKACFSRETTTTGWSASCQCNAAVAQCVVLDPFGGAGTTGLVADRLQRDAVMIELNPEYAAMARRRVSADAGMFGDVA